MKKFGLFVLLITMLTTMSCGEYELLENQRDCKRRADSLYRANQKLLIVEYDSICSANKDRYYQEALDSLIPARIAEMKKLINR